MDTPEPYDLDFLIDHLEKIYRNEECHLNYAKAFYTLALKIKEIKQAIEEAS